MRKRFVVAAMAGVGSAAALGLAPTDSSGEYDGGPDDDGQYRHLDRNRPFVAATTNSTPCRPRAFSPSRKSRGARLFCEKPPF
jgi:hypothetical protein